MTAFAAKERVKIISHGTFATVTTGKPDMHDPEALWVLVDGERRERLIRASNLERVGSEATAVSALEEGLKIVQGARRDDYGPVRDSFQVIADLWSPVLGKKVTPHQVALCMAQLKVARALASPGHRDSYVDGANYIALGYEVADLRSAS